MALLRAMHVEPPSEPPADAAGERQRFRALIESITGEKVRDLGLFTEACTHRSMERQDTPSQERLEYLGDSIAYAAVTSILHERFRHLDEGVLSRLRAKLVSGASLAAMGRALDLSRVVRMDAVVRAMLEHDKIYEDTLEALLGAVYLDSGFEGALRCTRRWLRYCVDAETLRHDDNYKDVLRRYLAHVRARPATYATERKGDAHVAVVEVHAGARVWTATAEHAQRRRAEAAAARAVLEQMGYDVEGETII